MAVARSDRIQYVVVEGEHPENVEAAATAVYHGLGAAADKAEERFRLLQGDSDGTTIVLVAGDGSVKTEDEKGHLIAAFAVESDDNEKEGHQLTNTNTAPTFPNGQDETETAIAPGGGHRILGPAEETQVFLVESNDEECRRVHQPPPPPPNRRHPVRRKEAAELLKGSKRRNAEKKIRAEDLIFHRRRKALMRKKVALQSEYLLALAKASNLTRQIDDKLDRVRKVKGQVHLANVAMDKVKGWKEVEMQISL